jgi:chromosome segregation ATPase
MIEPIMYFGIGFLVAALIGLVVIPLVHGRAVRLTMRRVEAATPLSMAEMQADKDQQRAEFAMSTRRLEMSVEELKARSTSQLAEIGKKGDAINRLKIELGEKTAAILALEARDKMLRDQLQTTEDEVAAKTTAMHYTERALTDKQAELAKMMGELDQQSNFADAQNAEIAALKGQIDGLKARLIAAGNAVKAVEDRREAERVELKAAAKALEDERGRVENLRARASELEQQLAAQTKEATNFGRHAEDLENRLSEHARLLTQAKVEIKNRLADIEAARKTEVALRASIADLEWRNSATVEQFKGEMATLQAEFDRTKEERDGLARDIAAMQREAEEAWANERVDNVFLRERINDVAVEVARLASSLEGPNSPIEALLAGNSERDRAAAPAAGNGAVELRQGEASSNLAERIRALQSHAVRTAPEDEPQARN